MKDIHQLKSSLSTLFREQYFAVLATRSGDQLHTTLVAFAATDDLKTLFVCTPRATRKYANLKQNPSVSLLVHNSANMATDIRQAMAVTVSGDAAGGSRKSVGSSPDRVSGQTAPHGQLCEVAQHRHHRSDRASL
jgi:hypothetical protein